GDDRLALGLQCRRELLSLMKPEPHLLEIEHDVRDVFFNACHRRKFMQDTFDTHRSYRVAGQRGQEDAAKRVANGDTIATLERLGEESPIGRRQLPGVELDGLGFDQITPIILHNSYFSAENFP